MAITIWRKQDEEINSLLFRLHKKLSFNRRFSYAKRRFGYYEKPSAIRKRKKQRKTINNSSVFTTREGTDVRKNRDMRLGLQLQFSKSDIVKHFCGYKIQNRKKHKYKE